MAAYEKSGITRVIHDITNAQFRSKFEDDLSKLEGNLGIGFISNYEDQPLIIGSHLGAYAIVTIGLVNNLDALAKQAFPNRLTHFSEMNGSEINQSELIATFINQEASFEAGIQTTQAATDWKGPQSC